MQDIRNLHPLFKAGLIVEITTFSNPQMSTFGDLASFCYLEEIFAKLLCRMAQEILLLSSSVRQNDLCPEIYLWQQSITKFRQFAIAIISVAAVCCGTFVKHCGVLIDLCLATWIITPEFNEPSHFISTFHDFKNLVSAL